MYGLIKVHETLKANRRKTVIRSLKFLER